MTLMRLQRALARAGVASRRAAEELIRADKVRVNGTVATLGMSVDPETDEITVQGRKIAQARTTWIALHKPLGYVVTRNDPEGRQTVFSMLPEVPGLTYVGRLDVMTSGLLLLTTDGGAAHRLMHPKFEVERSYRVVVHGHSEPVIRNAFERGIIIDGRPVNVVTLKIRPALEGSRGSLELLMVLKEGRYRIVRRICEQLNLKVERLIRLSYGPIRLGPMAPGTWRYLEKREIAAVSGARVGGAVHRDFEGESAGRRDGGSRKSDGETAGRPGGGFKKADAKTPRRQDGRSPARAGSKRIVRDRNKGSSQRTSRPDEGGKAGRRVGGLAGSRMGGNKERRDRDSGGEAKRGKKGRRATRRPAHPPTRRKGR